MAGEHAAPETEAWIPAQRRPAEHDATMVLPVYTPHAAQARTSTSVAELAPPAPARATPAAPAAPAAKSGRTKRPDALPSDERNMLIFVSAILAIGTLAILAMATVGR